MAKTNAEAASAPLRVQKPLNLKFGGTAPGSYDKARDIRDMEGGSEPNYLLW